MAKKSKELVAMVSFLPGGMWWCAPYCTSYNPNPGVIRLKRSELSPRIRAMERYRASRRNLWKLFCSLGTQPDYFVTITYDLGVLPGMKAKKGRVTEKTWKLFGRHRERLLRLLRQEVEWGVWTVEICGKTKALHIHLVLKTEGTCRSRLEKMIRKLWRKITGITKKKMVHVEQIYNASGLYMYLFDRAKSRGSYPLHNGKENKRRRTWGAINRRSMNMFRPERRKLTKALMNKVRKRIIQYQKIVKGELSPEEIIRLEKIGESGAFRQTYDERLLKKINKILVKYGVKPIEFTGEETPCQSTDIKTRVGMSKRGWRTRKRTVRNSLGKGR